VEPYGAPQLVTVLCGFLTICTGVALLQISRSTDGGSHTTQLPMSNDVGGRYGANEIPLRRLDGERDNNDDDNDTNALIAGHGRP
jgi:hypothetical protein